MRSAFSETFRNLRTNFFQTFLSVLGIVIGVGALVAMLAMIDGLEKFARDRIAEGSSLENLMVRAHTGTRIDGIFTERDTIAGLDEAVMAELLDSLPYSAKGQLTFNGATIGYTADSAKLGLRYSTVTLPLLEPMADTTLKHGRFLQEADGDSPLAFINIPLAKRLTAEEEGVANAVGRTILLHGDSVQVAGVFSDGQDQDLRLGMLLPAFRKLQEAPPAYPTMVLALDNVHDVLDAQEFTDGWLARHFADIPEATESFTQTGYLEQLAEGMTVFRLVMSFLVGIAVVVGGVGVMNVLLMSIAERTAEIGVRKAVGASRRTIIRQFLSESVAISLIGSFFGLLLGMIVALIAAPVLTMLLEEVQFQAVFTLNTLIVVTVVAVLVGIIFGTYPARKAAGLDPVVAIRR